MTSYGKMYEIYSYVWIGPVKLIMDTGNGGRKVAAPTVMKAEIVLKCKTKNFSFNYK